MARLPRYILPGVPQHVIQRGNNRSLIFYNEKDYLFYLEKMLQASQKYGCQIHSYILMTNHVHLLVTPNEENSISKMQQAVGRCYVQYFNYHYHRSGTLWEGRYKATLINSEEYLFTCMRYIEMNPVRAKMVQNPGDYRWSSYHYNALGKSDLLITPHKEYNLLGQTNSKRQQAYLALCQSLLSANDLNNIRQQTNKGWILGSELFKQQLKEKINRPLEARMKGGDRKSQQYNKINQV